MKSARHTRQTKREHASEALKAAILEGATHEYQRLVDRALAAGISEDELDVLIHDALELLFLSAEQPVTNRELAYFAALAPEPELV